jgi:hypothetical protein
MSTMFPIANKVDPEVERIARAESDVRDAIGGVLGKMREVYGELARLTVQLREDRAAPNEPPVVGVYAFVDLPVDEAMRKLDSVDDWWSTNAYRTPGRLVYDFVTTRI